MPLREAEAIVLRTYPLKEADRIVSFFAREFGKCRGVSRGARRTKSRFGAALEPLSHVRIAFFERENRDLSTIDRCEVVSSPMLANDNDYAAMIGRAYIAEVADRMLPDHEVNDRVFRLLALVLEVIRDGLPVWLPLTYYMYWMVRLGGFLASLGECSACKTVMADADDAYFHPSHDGVRCRSCRHPGSSRLSAAARQVATAISRTPLAQIDAAAWQTPSQAAELRLFLNQALEGHIESRLQSWPMLLSAAKG
jgi:DNA repair protein RecO (recombination protein O)